MHEQSLARVGIVGCLFESPLFGGCLWLQANESANSQASTFNSHTHTHTHTHIHTPTKYLYSPPSSPIMSPLSFHSIQTHPHSHITYLLILSLLYSIVLGKLPTDLYLNSAPQSSKCLHSRPPSTTFPHLNHLPLSRRHQQRCLPSSLLDMFCSTSTQATPDPPAMTRPMLWKHGPGTLPIAHNAPAHTSFTSGEEPFARKDNKGLEPSPIISITKRAKSIPL